MGTPQTRHVRSGSDLPYLAILLVALTFMAYLPALRGGFVFDDGPLIVSNRSVQADDGLYRIWFTTEAADYYPLTESLWWSEWRMFGYQAIGYHVVNVLLHAANAVLVCLILRRLKIPGAWLTGLVFAIHPVNVATVAWISEQKNTLSMLFYAVAILLYLRFYEDGRWWWYGFSLLAFLLALLSKTAVVMLPIVLLGCGWWIRGQLQRKDWLYAVPFFVFSLVLGLVTVWFQHHRAMQEPVSGGDNFLHRVVAAGWVPWFYLYKALLPVNLTLMYPKWQIDASRWISYLPGVLLIVCFLIFWRKRRTWGRPLLFGLGYFLATLFPVLGFFDQSFYVYSLVADHWMYYSIIGVIAVGVGAGQALFRTIGGQQRRWGIALAVGMLAALGGATWRRSGVYAADETLWLDTVTRNPAAWAAHNNLGVALAQRGKTEEAIDQYEQAVHIRPGYAEAHNNWGLALAQTGRMEDAIAQWKQAVQLTPDYVDAHYNLAVALARTGRMQEAIEQYQQVVRLRPEYTEAHNNFGVVLAKTGRMPEAIAQWEQAVRINPDYADAHINLGNALFQLGRVSEAFSHYQQALRINPDSPLLHNDLGVALEKMNRVAEAIEQYELALRLKPDLATARDALARLRAGQ